MCRVDRAFNAVLMCIENERLFSYGVDFSANAIEIAKKTNKGANFYCNNLVTDDVYNKHDYDVAVILEVLEHINDDLKVIESVPSGKRIIGSVPSFDSTGHVRMFKTKAAVRKRYEKLVKINRIEQHVMNAQNDKIFIFFGERL